MTLMELGIDAVERGYVPDLVTRTAIRRLCRQRIDRHHRSEQRDFTASLSQGPIALQTEAANRQHYDVPQEFFAAVLGPRLKYSCCYFPTETTTLAKAEKTALEITCERAQISDGQRILELGCGWGSLSLWMAELYPNSRITAVSNSSSQREFIQGQAKAAGFRNLEVLTADMNDFAPPEGRFDRIVSVEMFEHMHNLELLLERIAGWLHPQGRVFVHMFCHRHLAYPFTVDGKADWMARYFFTGGMMPSYDLLTKFPRHLQVVERTAWNGVHYRRTAEAWLANLDDLGDLILPVLAKAYGSSQANRWLQRWRMFFMAVAELFAMNEGEEWFIGHYLLKPASETDSSAAE